MKMRILVVDDDMISRAVLRNILTKRKFEVIEAENATQATRILTADSPIDLVISDIMMPEVSGLQLLQRIRENPRCKDLPVIMCTARGDRDSVVEAANLKISGYIVKPIVASQVLKKVNKVVQQMQPPIDNKYKVAMRLGMTAPAYMKVLADFLHDTRKRILRLHQAVNENSIPKIQMLANAIGGAADTLGAWGIRDAARRLEEIGQRYKLWEAEHTLATLSAEVTRLSEHVDLDAQAGNEQNDITTTVQP